MQDLFKRGFRKTKLTRSLLLACIFLLGVFLRFHDLSALPNGLQQDETSIGYNAYSILETGRDEYGKYLPVLFKAFGEYKLPGYIYLSVIPLSFLGPNAFAVRFVSAFFGSLTILALYFFIRELTDRKQFSLPLLSALFLAINPWHLHFSRGAFEVTPALFFILIGSYLFFLAKRKKSLSILLIAVIIATLSMYTYNIARLFTPLLFAYYFIFYRLDRFFTSRRDRFIFALCLSALFALFIFILLGQGGYSSTKGTLIFSSAEVQARLIEFRSYLITLPIWFTKIFFNIFFLTCLQYLQNILAYFSVSFLFSTGSTHGNHGIGNVGQMYLIEALFVLIGMISVFRVKDRNLMTLFIWGMLVIGVAALTREAPQATRGFFLIIPLVIFSAYGFICSIRFLLLLKSRLVRYFLFSAIMTLFIFNILYYFVSYYNRFPVLYAPQWRSQDKELADYIEKNEYRYDRILIDRKADLLYSSLLYYLPFPPAVFQKTSVRLPDDSEGFSKVQSFGKFVYKDIDWENDTKLPKTLIVTSPKQNIADLQVVKELFYPQRPVVESVGQEIMQFPVRDAAYVILQTKP